MRVHLRLVTLVWISNDPALAVSETRKQVTPENWEDMNGRSRLLMMSSCW